MYQIIYAPIVQEKLASLKVRLIKYVEKQRVKNHFQQ